MSHFSRIKTQMVEKEYLLLALKDEGYSCEEGEHLNVRGYGGKQTPVDIKVSAKKFLSYAIGFRKDGQTYEAEDKKRREEIDTRNQADQAVYQTEKQIKEMEEKMSADSKAKLEAAVGRVKEALKGSDINEIKSSTEALNQVWQQVATEMYQQAGPPPGTGPEPGAGPQAGPQGTDQPDSQPGQQPKQEDGAVDADFEVVN